MDYLLPQPQDDDEKKKFEQGFNSTPSDQLTRFKRIVMLLKGQSNPKPPGTPQ